MDFDSALAPLLIAVFVGGYSRGYSGFGMSAIVMAGGTLVLAPSAVVPIAITLEVVASVGQLPGTFRDVAWRLLALLLAGAAIGNPLGIYFLDVLDAGVVRIVLLTLILTAATIMLLMERRFALTHHLALVVAIGFASGFTNGLTALGGLPIILFLSASAVSPAQMRATLIAYFLISDAFAMSLLVANDIFTTDTLYRLAVLLPIMGIAVALGARGYRFATPEKFRRLALMLLITISALGLARALVVT